MHRPANIPPGQRLPVLFWIHGGGLTNGGANQYDGSLIATRTSTVVVTINYRLGVFGFPAHSALTSEAGQSGAITASWTNRRRCAGSTGTSPRSGAIRGRWRSRAISPAFTPAERRLSSDMVHAWGAFAHSGSPWAAGPAYWSGFSRTAKVMSLHAGGASVLLSDRQVEAEHSCDFWNSAGA